MYVGSGAQKGNERMRRRILLVDDEVAVLLTLKAVLEISGFDVDTAASAREGVSKLHTRHYHMLITDMRMESEAAGVEVIKAARGANYHPAVALLTAFPVADEDWQEMGADQLLVKPMHTRILLQQIEDLMSAHEAKLARLGLSQSLAGTGSEEAGRARPAAKSAPKQSRKPPVAKAARAGSAPTQKKPAEKAAGSKKTAVKKTVKKKAATKKSSPIKAVSSRNSAKKSASRRRQA